VVAVSRGLPGRGKWQRRQVEVIAVLVGAGDASIPLASATESSAGTSRCGSGDRDGSTLTITPANRSANPLWPRATIAA
jgi:hypothetical protein